MTSDRRAVATFGMWVFLASEGMLFAGLFALYAAYHHAFPAELAEAARHANRLLGTLNTYILITSSFTIATAIHRAREGRRYRAWILATVALGVAFEIIKATEYAQHLSQGFAPGGHFAFAELPARGHVFYVSLYFTMTGIHALHVAAGIAILSVFAARGTSVVRLELAGLYWHFVDVVWIFLWPLLYLGGGR